MGEVDEILVSHRGNCKAAVIALRDQAFGGQPAQRFTHRAQADVKPFTQRANVQLFAGLDGDRNNVLSKSVVDMRRQRLLAGFRMNGQHIRHGVNLQAFCFERYFSSVIGLGLNCGSPTVTPANGVASSNQACRAGKPHGTEML